MNIHIMKFIDRVRTAELRQQRDVIMSVREAQDLHADITKLLVALTALQEELNKKTQDSVIQVEMDGGRF